MALLSPSGAIAYNTTQGNSKAVGVHTGNLQSRVYAAEEARHQDGAESPTSVVMSLLGTIQRSRNRLGDLPLRLGHRCQEYDTGAHRFPLTPASHHVTRRTRYLGL